MSILFNNIYASKIDNRPLVDLSDWAKLTYPSTYQNFTSLPTEGEQYLNSVKPTCTKNLLEHCTNLQTVDCSKWDLSECTNMYYTFSYCYNVQELDVSNWDVSKVQNMFGLFDRCRTITTLDLTKWDTRSCTSVEGLFFDCESLDTIDLSNFNTSNLVQMRYLFCDCHSLRIIDLTNWDSTKQTSSTMTQFFTSCDKLEYLIIGTDTFKFPLKSSSHNLNTTCKILVPSSLISTYQNDTNWSSRASQFDAIENYTITRSNGQVTVTPK